jgi:acyl-CoA thioesterase
VAEPPGFDADTAVTERDRGEDRASFDAEVSAHWRAGRGPHGGYLAAIILRALCRTLDDRRRAPRSLTIHYARAPRPGPVRIDTVIERAGRSLSTVSARMEQEGKLMALALSAFSVPWSAPELGELSMPEVAPPDAERDTPQPLAQQIEQGLAPRFLARLVMQPRIGSIPFGGQDGPMEVGAWLGLRGVERPLDALALALFSDALFSPPFMRLSSPATSPTIDLTIHFRSDLREAQGGLCFARFHSHVVHEGFFEEDGVIWAPDGTVLAQSRQLAILMPLEGSR